MDIQDFSALGNCDHWVSVTYPQWGKYYSFLKTYLDTEWRVDKGEVFQSKDSLFRDEVFTKSTCLEAFEMTSSCWFLCQAVSGGETKQFYIPGYGTGSQPKIHPQFQYKSFGRITMGRFIFFGKFFLMQFWSESWWKWFVESKPGEDHGLIIIH